MKLHPPFIISARLLPALRIGEATLSLESIARASKCDAATSIMGPRHAATFILDMPDGEYRDASLSSGCGGFGGTVAPFESFLAFLIDAAESRYPDHTPAFPANVVQWARDNVSELECIRMDITGENGDPNESLITEGDDTDRLRIAG